MYGASRAACKCSIASSMLPHCLRERADNRFDNTSPNQVLTNPARAAALRLMRAKGSGQSNFSIISSICAQRVRLSHVEAFCLRQNAQRAALRAAGQATSGKSEVL